jgi:hypothetical protein
MPTTWLPNIVGGNLMDGSPIRGSTDEQYTSLPYPIELDGLHLAAILGPAKAVLTFVTNGSNPETRGKSL